MLKTFLKNTFYSPIPMGFRFGLMILFAFVCSSCGGGSGSGSETETPPTISTQPISQTVSVGIVAKFSVVANGAGPISYQWKRNGSDISGATMANYTLTKAQLVDNQSTWTVVVSNGAGSVTSAAATLTVNVPVPGISLFAGRLPGLDGQGSAASFADLGGVAVDVAGNIYVADFYSHNIRKITPSGLVTTIAGTVGLIGSADGQGATAGFRYPSGICVDIAGNLYIADSGNRTIRKITPSGFVTTIAGMAGVGGTTDGVGTSARFVSPTGITIDVSGNLYVTDNYLHNIRKISASGQVTTLAGSSNMVGSADGLGMAARFYNPTGITVDITGNIYVADQGNHSIRKITPSGNVTTLAGNADIIGTSDGIGASASFFSPSGITVDVSGNVFVSDGNANTIRKISAGGIVSTLAGTAGIKGSSDALGIAASFNSPAGLGLDVSGNLYVGDSGNGTLRKIVSSGLVTTLAGNVNIDIEGQIGIEIDGVGAAAKLVGPMFLAIDANDNLYFTSRFSEASVRKISPPGAVSTLIKSIGNKYDYGIIVDPLHNIYVNYSGYSCGRSCTVPKGVIKVDPSGGMALLSTSLHYLAADNAGSIYGTDGIVINKTTSDGSVIAVAGTSGVSGSVDGVGAAARFVSIHKGALDAAGNLYVSDSYNRIIRKITPSGVVTTLAGRTGSSAVEDGLGSSASFDYIRDMAVDASGNIYVTDTDTIRKITPAGLVTTVVGKVGTKGIVLGSLPGSLNFPLGLAIDSNGVIFVSSGNVILKIQL